MKNHVSKCVSMARVNRSALAKLRAFVAGPGRTGKEAPSAEHWATLHTLRELPELVDTLAAAGPGALVPLAELTRVHDLAGCVRAVEREIVRAGHDVLHPVRKRKAAPMAEEDLRTFDLLSRRWLNAPSEAPTVKRNRLLVELRDSVAMLARAGVQAVKAAS